MPDQTPAATPPPAGATRALHPGVVPAAAMADVVRALFEQSPLSTVVYDTAGRLLAVNAAFERLFGLTLAGIPADYSVLTDPQLERAGHLDHVRRAFAGEVVVLPPVRYDAVELDAGGRSSWTQGHFFPMRDAAGAVTGVVLVHMDLTARIEAEAEADAARERLEQQAIELEAQTEQLQNQSADLQSQQVELEQQAEELQTINEELHQANDELAAAEASVRAILGAIGDPFVVQDAEWRFRYLNEAAAAALARTGHRDPDALIGRVVWDVYPELVGGRIEAGMRRAQRERIPLAFTEFNASSGNWAELRCYPMPDGGLATLWKDVTAAKRAEESRHYLARASEIFAESLDTDETARQLAFLLVPTLADWTSVQLLDDAGTLRQAAVAHVDPAKVAWARELNDRYPPDPEQPHGAHEVVRSGKPMLLPHIPEELLASVARDAEHLRILREIGFTSALTVPLAARGRTIGVMTLVSAESGRRYGEAELALAQELATRAALAFDNAALYGAAVRARAEAEAANRAKADFLATMSHELRTPLNAIGGYAQLLELGVHGPVNDDQLEALRRVQRSQGHLLSLINDVLNFAKLEAGRVSYDIGRVGLQALVAELEPLVAPQLAAKSLRYACDAIDPALAVTADEEKAQQVLLNLLSNAIKFTPEGGAVRLTTTADADTVRVTVSDTGPGIAADKLEVIFEPFVQLARTGAAGREGTGLGLAISRDLARAMGGELTVRSSPGEGSTFTLALPRAAGPA